MSRIRIGIVGYGKIAADQHAPAIRDDSEFELLAATSGRDVRLPKGVRAFATQAEMLAGCPQLDAVAICTPPGPRPALVREALAARLHVLMEKPPAATVTEADDLARLATETDRSLFATWHARFHPAVEELRSILAEDQIRRLAVSWKEDVRHWHPGQDWIWQPGGFGVFDPGINALSILTRVVPGRLVVTGAELSVPANRATPIAATLRFSTHGSDASLTAEFDWRQTGPQQWDVDVETRSGRHLRLRDGGATLDPPGGVPADASPGEYPLIYRRFGELIRTGASDVDLSPLRLVADAFLLGIRREVEPFD